jgi:hypothetical protein
MQFWRCWRKRVDAGLARESALVYDFLWFLHYFSVDGDLGRLTAMSEVDVWIACKN